MYAVYFHSVKYAVFRPCRYTYKLGHRLFNGTYVWSQKYQFSASPYPGENSLQRVVIFGDMGKVLTLMKTICECYVLKLTFLSHAVLHPNV